MPNTDFDFDSIQYPAFVVVYGPSKNTITKYNRDEYGEQFACDMCVDGASARRLLEGYPGPHSQLKVYAIPKPALVQQLLYGGQVSTEYESDDHWLDMKQDNG